MHAKLSHNHVCMQPQAMPAGWLRLASQRATCSTAFQAADVVPSFGWVLPYLYWFEVWPSTVVRSCQALQMLPLRRHHDVVAARRHHLVVAAADTCVRLCG
jgi:hypothetical protein